ncbi:MAG: fumarylacetoacetate hydrolase family protein [Pseudomonadota bacterium]
MRWATFDKGAGARAGLVEGETVVELGTQPLEQWFAAPDEALARAKTAPRHALSEVRLRQPVLRPGKILGVALNYRDHARETGREPPAVQTWFAKQATAANGPFDPVTLPAVSDQLDYEAELVVVIGKRGRHVPATRALEIAAGFCCGCDYSVRDWQRAAPTMMMGKGFDTHAPFGPWVVSPDELGDLDALGVRCLVNGEIRQDGRIGDMIFKVAEQIEHLTKAFTLEPGDLLFTGTPAGVGMAFDPPKFVKAGDLVRVEIDRIGAIEQEIVAEHAETIVG